MLANLYGTQRFVRWSLFVLLAWAIHVPSFAEGLAAPCDKAMHAVSMADCQACCADAMPASVSAESRTGYDDNPAALLSPPGMLPRRHFVVQQTTTGSAIPAHPPLRVLYCRWLT